MVERGNRTLRTPKVSTYTKCELAHMPLLQHSREEAELDPGPFSLCSSVHLRSSMATPLTPGGGTGMAHTRPMTAAARSMLQDSQAIAASLVVEGE